MGYKNLLEQHFGNNENVDVRTAVMMLPLERDRERERQSERMGEVAARRDAGLYAARDVVM